MLPRSTRSCRLATVSFLLGALCLGLPAPVVAEQPAVLETAEASAPRPAPLEQRWNLHGQVTGIWQGYGRIRSPYEGDNSLPGGGQGKETVSVTPFLGVRLWQGGEFYFNPEAFQGFGLARTHGLGGFSNGEAQKGGSLSIKPYVARAFVRQAFGFGGESEQVADEINQLAGMRDVSRATLTVGRFSVTDLFDQNSYAHDSREGFLNYSIWEGGAFDYAADQRGYSGGAAIDFNQKMWAFRTGYFLVPIKSNAQTLSWDLANRGQVLSELELRYALMQQPGILRLLGWQQQVFAGNYSQATRDPDFDPEGSIAETRRVRTQLGYVINLEQAITDQLGLFSRYSWRDARSEIMSWTDIDRSFSLGLSLKGASWGRPHDTIGLAGALNTLSKSHQQFSALGGLGVTIGDGRLSYSGEKVLETYYQFNIGKGHQYLMFDYQLIGNPAYNTDRGPVSLFAMRVHSEF